MSADVVNLAEFKAAKEAKQAAAKAKREQAEADQKTTVDVVRPVHAIKMFSNTPRRKNEYVDPDPQTTAQTKFLSEIGLDKLDK